MTEVSRVIETDPRSVFAVLADGWSYAGWVVGAAHIRDVDPGWPAVGSRIHHKVGPWPLQMNDVTVVCAMRPGRLLELDAELRPFGSAVVRLELTPVEGGTEVRMTEKVVRGPASLLPEALQAALLKPRNAEALSRLADIATGRARQVPAGRQG